MVFKQIQRESRPHALITDIVNSRSCVTDYLVYILKKSKNIFIKKKKRKDCPTIFAAQVF